MTTDPLPLDPASARNAVAGALLSVVPDADLTLLDDRAPFRDELELDSLDFLAFVEELSAATGVLIDEEDYRLVSTIAGCVELLTEA